MNPDDFKQTWQTQSSQTHLTIDADLLLKEVKRNHRHFTAMIFWRDVREVGVAFLLVPVWIYLGTRSSLPWTWYLAVPALVWIAGFMLVDRMYHKRQAPEVGGPLSQYVEMALVQVDHQIWLLRNVFWWYVLPLAVPILAFFGHVAWNDRLGGWWTALGLTAVVSIATIVFAFVYWLNQNAVRSELRPRRQELETLLTSVQDETPAASP